MQNVPFAGKVEEEVDIEEDRKSMVPTRDSCLNQEGDILIPNKGNISFLEYLRLAELYDAQIHKRCRKLAGSSEESDKNENKFLESSHLILFKWKDYFNIPKKFDSNFIYGKQRKLENGEYDPLDNSRTLFGFRDIDSFFVVALAYIVLFAELAILMGVVYDLVGEGCDGKQSAQVISLTIELCTFYAASVASHSYFRFCPFETTGQTPAGYCVLAEAALLRGEKKVPSYFNNIVIFGKDIEQLLSNKEKIDRETKSLLLRFTAETILNDLFIFGTAVALQLCNFLLLTTVAMVMATSPDLLTLIQNFVSVEIVVHIHEFIPTALRIEDRSPDKFNVSYVDWYKELERVGLLSDRYPQTEKRIRKVPDTFYRLIFIFFGIYTFIVYSVTSTVCKSGGNF